MTPHCEWCPFPGCDSCAYKGHERVVLLAACVLDLDTRETVRVTHSGREAQR